MTDWLPGTKDQFTSYQFYLELDGITEGQFREVSGISSETTVIESKESTKEGKTVIKKMPGQHKWGDITLKRGFTDALNLYEWRQKVLDGKIMDARKNGSIVVYDFENKEVMRYNFVNAWPSKLTGPNLNASSDEVVIEEMTICCEGIDRIK